MYRVLLFVGAFYLASSSYGQELDVRATNLAGVFQGKTLFIQNSFNRETGTFCVEKILINNEPLLLNYKLSALKLDFETFDLFTPVNVSIFA